MLGAICLAMGSLLFLSSCGYEDLMLEEELVAPFYLGFTDTVSLQMSSMQADSIISSGTGRLLIGSLEDEYLGKLRAQTFFQLGLNGLLLPSEDAVYDSLVLYLTTNNYIYGDSSQPQKISVHRITEEYNTVEDDYFYNTQSLRYEESALGALSFSPNYRQRDSLSIRLNDEWGKALFEMGQNGDVALSTTEVFQEYLPGLTLLADSTSGGAVLGYAASASQIYMRLYYHQTGEELQTYTYDFQLSNSTQQFNQFESTRTQNALADLQSVKKPLADTITDQMTFVQGGSGLITRINIPHLEDFPELGEYMYITQAELVLKPVLPGETQFNLPDSLLMFTVDHPDDIMPLISFGVGDSDTWVWMSGLQLDDEYDRNTEYRFNITDFIVDEVSSDALSEKFLVLTLPNLSNQVHSMYLGSDTHPEYQTKLEISYSQLTNLIN